MTPLRTEVLDSLPALWNRLLWVAILGPSYETLQTRIGGLQFKSKNDITNYMHSSKLNAKYLSENCGLMCTSQMTSTSIFITQIQVQHK